MEIKTFTDAEIAEMEKKEQIKEAKLYLANTDWAAAKLAEAQAGIITEDIKTKYADIFIKREQTRTLINSLES